MAVFLLKPRSRGRVSLTSSDPAAPPRIEHGFLADPGDVEPLVDGVGLALELARREPLAAYVSGGSPAAEDVEAYVRANVRGYFHPVGTCALGSVCDGRARVVGHESLVVADASLLPTIPRANTNLSVLAVAEKVAETLG